MIRFPQIRVHCTVLILLVLGPSGISSSMGVVYYNSTSWGHKNWQLLRPLQYVWRAAQRFSHSVRHFSTRLWTSFWMYLSLGYRTSNSETPPGRQKCMTVRQKTFQQSPVCHQFAYLAGITTWAVLLAQDALKSSIMRPQGHRTQYFMSLNPEALLYKACGARHRLGQHKKFTTSLQSRI